MTPESKVGIAEIKNREPGTYKIREIFYSIQGEGPDVGRPAVFVRFSHCNLSCSWCDTDYDVKGFWFTAPQILFEAEQAMVRGGREGGALPMVVFTGGEPTLQLDRTLIDGFRARGFTFLAIETNGVEWPSAGLDRVVISPKTPGGWWGSSGNLDSRDVFKVVLDPGNPNMEKILSRAEGVAAPGCLFLSPLEDQKTKETNVKDCIAFVLANPRWRLSLQTHKVLGLR